MTNINSPDLTQRPPRSPRVTLGGYVLLPRILDKSRASIAGKLGEFRFGTQSMDRHFLNFTGIEEAALKAEIATGKSDSEMLAWVQANAKPRREPWEVAQWSNYQIQRSSDSDAVSRSRISRAFSAPTLASTISRANAKPPRL